MKRFGMIVFLWGCGAAQPVAKQPALAPVCDLADPAIGFLHERDQKNGRLSQERVDADGDGTFEVVLDYVEVDATRTDLVGDGRVQGTITRSADKEVIEMSALPGRTVTYFQDGLPVRVESDELDGGLRGVDGKVDSVRTFVYEKKQLVGERLEADGRLIETVEHVYKNGQRERSVRTVHYPTPQTLTLHYAYTNGRCVATVSYSSEAAQTSL